MMNTLNKTFRSLGVIEFRRNCYPDPPAGGEGSIHGARYSLKFKSLIVENKRVDG